MSNAFERVEDFIWGRCDEDAFLRDVVADERLDTERLLAKVQAIQSDLNTRLRQGVEENYPRLLEQVSAIEHLDSAHSQFQHEMDAVAKRADQLARTMDEQVIKIRKDVFAVANLTKLARLQGDALRCEQLGNAWKEEKDLSRRAEIVAELNATVKNNDKLKHLKWLHDRCLFNVPEMTVRTRQELAEQLRNALRSLNAPTVADSVKALHKLLDGTHSCQKELNALIDEAVMELDALFLRLGAQSAQEKAGKLMPQLSTKLHSQLEQFQLLGNDNAQQFARHVSKVIAARVPANAPYAMRLVQTIYKCVGTHADPVANIIRDALNPLKTSILSQSLSNLFSMIDEVFEHDERRDTILVEKLNAAFRAELASVGWDAFLQQEMEGNIAKALKYVAVKIEQQLSFGEETLRFIGRISRAQLHNYQLLNIAQELARHWPAQSAPLKGAIQPAVQTIMERMRTTVSLVLASMHDENMLQALAPGASSSEYVKELCAHLKVFRQHCAQVKALADSVDALPAFLNFCIEQFLFHISLIRPLRPESADRFVRDLEYLCRTGLDAFDCKYAKMLNAHRQIQEFLQQMPANLAAVHDQRQSDASAKAPPVVPNWFIVQMLICTSGDEMRLPHDSAGWTLSQYVSWFNSHGELERWRFYRGLLDAYKQSVVASDGTEFVQHFPLLVHIVDANLRDAANNA